QPPYLSDCEIHSTSERGGTSGRGTRIKRPVMGLARGEGRRRLTPRRVTRPPRRTRGVGHPDGPEALRRALHGGAISLGQRLFFVVRAQIVRTRNGLVGFEPEQHRSGRTGGGTVPLHVPAPDISLLSGLHDSGPPLAPTCPPPH